MRPKKRFIAGARCPHCQAIDRVALYSVPAQDGQPARDWIECVVCGHQEARPELDESAKTVNHLATDATAVGEAVPGIVQFRP